MKIAIALVALLLLIVLLVLGAFYLNQRQLIYYPQLTPADAIAPSYTLRRADDIVLRGWVDAPGQSRALLYFGGNAETLQPTRRELADCCPGWARYFLPYRGYGGSDGAPEAKAILADALAFYDDVAARHPGQPIAIIGRSLGSGVAAYVASQRPLAKLVLITPFDSLHGVARVHYPWLPVGLLLREHYDSADWLRGKPLDIMLVRASHDEVIPAANTEALLRALPANTRVIALDGDHNVFAEPARLRQALVEFLD